jgi:hypothetical protein
MSTELRGYRRVASLYKWDYQKAEMALADAMEEDLAQGKERVAQRTQWYPA